MPQAPQAQAPLTIQDGVATVVLASTPPQGALSLDNLRSMRDVARQLHERSDLRAVVLTGSANRFCAGMDVSVLAASRDASLLQRRQWVRLGPEMCDAWAALEVPTIAAIEGACVGGGLALALACDFRVLSDRASLRLPEVPLGMNMSWHTLPRLVALVGPARAKRIAMAGEALDAATAAQWGLADHVVPAEQALPRAQAWAQTLAALPPVAVRMTKESINAIAQALAPLASHMDRDQFLLTQDSEDLREGIQAWQDKRPPQFQGR